MLLVTVGNKNKSTNSNKNNKHIIWVLKGEIRGTTKLKKLLTKAIINIAVVPPHIFWYIKHIRRKCFKSMIPVFFHVLKDFMDLFYLSVLLRCHLKIDHCHNKVTVIKMSKQMYTSRNAYFTKCMFTAI